MKSLVISLLAAAISVQALGDGGSATKAAALPQQTPPKEKWNTYHWLGGRVYVSATLGWSIPAKTWGSSNFFDKRHRGTGLYGIGVGYLITPAFRLGAELHTRHNFRFKSNEGNTHRLSSTSVMAVGQYDFLSAKPISPYVSGGLGVSFNRSEDYVRNGEVFSGRNLSNFSWQLGTGVRWAPSESARWQVQAGYRYVYSGLFMTDSLSNQPVPVPVLRVRPIEGRAKAHEFLLTLSCKI